jgi:hypothetical protein
MGKRKTSKKSKNHAVTKCHAIVPVNFLKIRIRRVVFHGNLKTKKPREEPAVGTVLLGVMCFVFPVSDPGKTAGANSDSRYFGDLASLRERERERERESAIFMP